MIELAPGADLRTAYTTAHALAQARLGDAFGGIRVRDDRDDRLADSFYRMHFHIQQGIATGMFTAMADDIEAIARADSLTAHQIFVADDNVYVQLELDGRALYEVVPRPRPGDLTGPERSVAAAW